MRNLLKPVLVDYLNNWWALVSTILVVLAPVAILTSFSPSNGIEALSAYAAVAIVIANIALAALALAIVHRESPLPDLPELYYRRATVVRVFLVLVNPLVWLTLLPLIIGIGLYGAVTSSSGLQSSEQAILALVAVLMAIPSLFFTAWLSPVVYVLLDSQLGPWQSIKASFRLVWGNTARTILRLLGLVAVALVVTVPLSLIFGLVSSLLGATWLLTILQIVLGITVVPIMHLWLARMYVLLKADFKPKAAK